MARKTYVIAEIGINHNGSFLIAKQLIDAAKAAGADAVKFQKRTIDKVYTPEELDRPRESPWGTTYRAQKEGLEFGRAEYDAINEYCKEVEIEWFASVWDLPSVEFLKPYNLKYNKIPSARVGHKELLQAVAKEGKTTLLSTGMSTPDEIAEAGNIFEQAKCPVVLMHCNSQYPMPDRDANLRLISKYLELDIPVGYSGHEVGLITSVAAVALGAQFIERHITLDRAMYGTDQAASVEPGGFKRMIEYIEVVEQALGNADRIIDKVITNGEKKIREKLWRTYDVGDNPSEGRVEGDTK